MDRLETLGERAWLHSHFVWLLRVLALGLPFWFLLALASGTDLLLGRSIALWVLLLTAWGSGLAAVARQPLSLLEVAKAYDRRLHLDERLATALETVLTSPKTPLARIQVVEAAVLSRRVDPGTAFPWPRPKGELGVLMAFLLIASLWLVSPGSARWLWNEVARSVASLGSQAQYFLMGQGKDGLLSWEEGDGAAEGTQPSGAGQPVALGKGLLPRRGLSAMEIIAEKVARGEYRGAVLQLDRLAQTLAELGMEDLEALTNILVQVSQQLRDDDPAVADKLLEAVEALTQDDLEAAKKALREATRAISPSEENPSFASDEAESVGQAIEPPPWSTENPFANELLGFLGAMLPGFDFYQSEFGMEMAILAGSEGGVGGVDQDIEVPSLLDVEVKVEKLSGLVEEGKGQRLPVAADALPPTTAKSAPIVSAVTTRGRPAAFASNRQLPPHLGNLVYRYFASLGEER